MSDETLKKPKRFDMDDEQEEGSEGVVNNEARNISKKEK